MFAKVHAVATQVGEIVVGKDMQIRQALTCLLAGGHLPVSYTHLTLPTNREV